jgi:hypothetical protein
MEERPREILKYCGGVLGNVPQRTEIEVRFLSPLVSAL